MRARLFFNFAILLLLGIQVAAQENVKIEKDEFRTDKPGFEGAWKSLSRGDKYYAEGVLSYPEAIGEYSNAMQYNPECAGLNYKIGVCHLFTTDREMALDYLLRALSINPQVAEDILLMTGRAYQYKGRFIEAVGKYTEYLETPSKKSPELLALVRRYIDEGNAGMVMVSDTARLDIRNAGDAINSPFDDYSIVFNDDISRMYFASRRPAAKKPAGTYNDELPDENIYISTNTEGKWGFALPLEGKINSGYCEAPLFLTSGGTIMYTYSGFSGEGDIQVSKLKKGNWKSPGAFNGGGVNTLFPETSVAFSPDGEEMVFVSARKQGSAGGKDIYISRKVKGKRWGSPENLLQLNSPLDEESVRYSRGGDTLWFSSRGHNTIGGFDIFMSVRTTDGTWGAPRNAGLPLNTVYDDLFYYPSSLSDSTFWLVSNRKGGFGGLDIYNGIVMPPEPEPEPEPVIPQPEPVVPVPEPVKVVDTVYIVKEVIKEAQPVVAEPVFFIEGRILDSETETPLAARIDIIDPDTYQVAASLISGETDGVFRVNVRNRKNYMLEIRSNGYLSDMRKIEIPAAYIGETFFTNFYLNKITVGRKVVLNNIFFETGKAVLTPASYGELDKLTTIMKENPGMRIEISGHTDNTGSAAVNTRLSLERATAVSGYLKSKGVEAIRIETKGFGSSQPIEPNETPEGRAANRRVEFKILEF
ncbi:MAG: OmpA family protein [Bacteroidales bacterium]|nr:OmpA family protein [Bacteroidales bacterium]